MSKITTLTKGSQKPTLGELQSLVGGYIQVAYTSDDGKIQIIVDEEGKLKGKHMNVKATELWWRLTNEGSDNPMTFEDFTSSIDYLVGDVVVLKGKATID